MARDGRGGGSGLGGFLKRRAPIYLGVAALFAVFAVPELTKGTLESSLPEMTAEEARIVGIVMGYDGPNGSGLTVMEAIEGRIAEQYPNERIFDNRKTTVGLGVAPADGGMHRVTLDFESYKGAMSYDWHVDGGTGEITPNNGESRHIIEVVDFYD